MASFIYISKRYTATQEQIISDYFNSKGTDKDSLIELRTSNVSKIIKLLRAGDKLYLANFSYIGDSLTEIYFYLKNLYNKNVTVIQCKDGKAIDEKTLWCIRIAMEAEKESIEEWIEKMRKNWLEKRRMEKGG
jgi:hypothetical protein